MNDPPGPSSHERQCCRCQCRSPGPQLKRKEASLAGLVGNASRCEGVSRCLILGGALSEYHRTVESSELEGTRENG